MPPVPDTVDLIVRISQALLTPAIACVTVYIARQQYRLAAQQFHLAQEKQRHELYNRRAPIFKAAMEFISHVARTGKAPDDQLYKLLRETSERRFLFPSEIDAFILELYKKGIDLEMFNDQRNNASLQTGNEGRGLLAGKRADLAKWFGEQFETGTKLFEPYLAFQRREIAVSRF